MADSSLPENDFVKKAELGISIQTEIFALFLQIALKHVDLASAHLLSFEPHKLRFLWLRYILLCLSSLLALEAGYRVPRRAHALTFLQVVAMAGLAQVFFQNEIGVAPVSTILVVGLSLTAGNFLKLIKERELRYQAQFYNLAIKSREVDETRLSLVKQEEAERRILACDLHDQVLNDIKQVKSKVAKLPTTDKSAELVAIESLLDSTAVQIRSVMESLCPSVLENLGLKSALEELLREASAKGDFKARLEASQFNGELGKIEELLLFRIAQEVLNNAVKHSGAKSVTMKLVGENDLLTLSITDNGKGIDPQVERGQSRGLRYIRQRADLLQAKASWKNEERGLTFELTMPMRK